MTAPRRDSESRGEGMRILAIDPGPSESAWVEYDDYFENPVQEFGKWPNDKVLSLCCTDDYDEVVIEMIASYGMAVGKEVFETCVWIGRFMQMFPGYTVRITRNEIKNHLCHSSKANDSNIRQAIIDRFGGQSAIGLKKSPGPLYGISKDVWAALAVALTWADRCAWDFDGVPYLSNATLTASIAAGRVEQGKAPSNASQGTLGTSTGKGKSAA